MDAKLLAAYETPWVDTVRSLRSLFSSQIYGHLDRNRALLESMWSKKTKWIRVDFDEALDGPDLLTARQQFFNDYGVHIVKHWPEFVTERGL